MTWKSLVLLGSVVSGLAVMGVTRDEFQIRDPFVLAEKGTYYLYESKPWSGGRGVAVRTSSDLEHWTDKQPVMVLPDEVKCTAVWAPEVHRYAGAYWLFTTLTFAPDPAHPIKPMLQSGFRGGMLQPRGVWVFRAESPKGPFKPVKNGSVTPVEWMCLDGTLWVEDGVPWMVFCHEWCQTGNGRMMAAPMSKDLSRFTAEPVELFRAADAPGGGHVTDGPFLHRMGNGGLAMTWSNFLKPDGYCVLQCTSATGRVTGPWGGHRPLFRGDGGHGMVFQAFNGQGFLTFHQPNKSPNERMKLFPVCMTPNGLVRTVADNPIRGPFPLLCTPWTAEGALDTVVLAREAAFMSEKGAAGVIWPTAGEVADLVEEGEYVKGLDALAARAAQQDFKAILTAICPGKTSAEALARVREVNEVQSRHGVKMAILARPPDDARTQAQIESHYRELAKIATCPVIIQTFNGKSPQPDVELLVRLARDYPQVYGYVKEESPGGQVNDRIAKLVAAKPTIKTVFSGWGAKGWLYQSRALGTEGMITQRPAYTDLLAAMWREQQRGDPDGRLAEFYSKYLLMINLGSNFSSGSDQMRGPHLYVLMKRGVFDNTYTRRRPKKNEHAKGRKWIVEEFKASDSVKAEIERRMSFCGM